MSGGDVAAFFADRLELFGDAPALITDTGSTVTYRELALKADAFAASLRGEKKLLVVETLNQPEPIIAYLGALRGRHPVLLAEDGATKKDGRILETFSPYGVFRRADGRWGLEVLNNYAPVELYADLSVLLSTSGSTGSPKLVRLSRENISSNADAIAGYLRLDPQQRAITSLPFHYSYGMSVINSHLAVGASLLLTDDSVISPTFWDVFVRHSATNFAGVPYTFELLERIKFRGKELPSLNCVTQAGGRLAPELVGVYDEWAKERDVSFFVMYGQTEAAPRMSFLPPEQLGSNVESIGRAIPGGEFCIVDEDKSEIRDPGRAGELVYRGPNVMLGYALAVGDLARGREVSELYTGDLASRNEAGLYQIVGRKSRFSKLMGLRIDLDEIERCLAQKGIIAAAASDDASIVVGVVRSGNSLDVAAIVVEQSGLATSNIVVLEKEELPLLPNGKTNYSALLREAAEQVASIRNNSTEFPTDTEDVLAFRSAFQWAVGVQKISDGDSFSSLGGDSLSYVHASIAIENYLKYLPDKWEEMPFHSLLRLKPRTLPEPASKPARAPGLDTNIVLRATAICGVLLHHASHLPMEGGAALLLLLAGHSFARFHSNRLYAGTLGPIFVSYAANVFIPYYLVMVVLCIMQGHLDVPQALFLGTFFVHSHRIGMFWFMEILLYSLVVVGSLFLFPAFRSWTKAKPLMSSSAILATATGVKLLVDIALQGTLLPTALPENFIFFALGWCLYSIVTGNQKLAMTGFVVALTSEMYFLSSGSSSRAVWILIGALLIIWTKRLWVSNVFSTPLRRLAAASFYIYLMQVFPLEYFIRGAPSLNKLPMFFFTSVVLGVFVFWLSRVAKSTAQQALSNLEWRRRLVS